MIQQLPLQKNGKNILKLNLIIIMLLLYYTISEGTLYSEYKDTGVHYKLSPVCNYTIKCE